MSDLFVFSRWGLLCHYDNRYKNIGTHPACIFFFFVLNILHGNKPKWNTVHSLCFWTCSDVKHWFVSHIDIVWWIMMAWIPWISKATGINTMVIIFFFCHNSILDSGSFFTKIYNTCSFRSNVLSIVILKKASFSFMSNYCYLSRSTDFFRVSWNNIRKAVAKVAKLSAGKLVYIHSVSYLMLFAHSN